MANKKLEHYTIERTFLAKCKIEDILGRIIKAHINYNLIDKNTKENKQSNSCENNLSIFS